MLLRYLAAAVAAATLVGCESKLSADLESGGAVPSEETLEGNSQEEPVTTTSGKGSVSTPQPGPQPPPPAPPVPTPPPPQQVTAPDASSPSGLYVNRPLIALSTPVDGAEIFYTLDGSEPTTASPKYTAPLRLKKSATIKAVAKKEGHPDSNVSTFSYTVVTSLADPQPAPGNAMTAYGGTLPNGNIYVIRRNADINGVADAGSMTLYDGETAEVISNITGSQTGDFSAAQVKILTNGNFVLYNYSWDNGAVVDAGAVTFCSATSGCSGAISASNSLVGTSAGDYVGSNITALKNGNYVVSSPSWANGGVTKAGAATFCSGTNGCVGAVTNTNSLVGSTIDDQVGQSVHVLNNGHYVVQSTNWDLDATNTNAGAATWCSGTTGCNGAVSVANSLVGSKTSDGVGAVSISTDSYYVLIANYWDNGAVTNAGAVTWCSATTGCTGAVSSANSLVGSNTNDGSFNVTLLANGNYVVGNPNIDVGGFTNAGSVTFCLAATGCSGAVTAANSLIGANNGHLLGSVYVLKNNSYVAIGNGFNSGTTNTATATWCPGSTGCVGSVSAANSYTNVGVGMAASTVTSLANGDFLVVSTGWDNGATTDVGAVAWCSGTGGCNNMQMSAANALIGSGASDVCGRVAELSNGNYLVTCKGWDNGAASNAGAVTFCRADGSCIGPISSTNSLVGSTASDSVGDYTGPLKNGNYVIASPLWDNGTIQNVGAVTWCSGTTGCTGPVSTVNSLHGNVTNDAVGYGTHQFPHHDNAGVRELETGDYVVRARFWDNGPVVDTGAVIKCSGTAGCTGQITETNSVVGTTASETLGASPLFVLKDGGYAINSPLWDNGAETDVGAVRRCNGTDSCVGPLTEANAVVGSAATPIGVVNLIYGRSQLHIRSPLSNLDNLTGVGSITICNTGFACAGAISPAISLFGRGSNDNLGDEWPVSNTDTNNVMYVVKNWDSVDGADTGAVYVIDLSDRPVGVLAGP